MSTKNTDPRAKSRNEDPITGEPGAHPVGVGVGAATGGAATGAAVGTIAGPIGTAVGAAAGAVVGGLAGKAVAEQIDPTVHDVYWNEQYTSRPYYTKGMTFDDYRPAYHYGALARTRYPGKRFDEIESDLGAAWHTAKGKSRLEWERARDATRDAWDRAESVRDR